MSLRSTDRLGWLDACEQIRQLASRYAVAMGDHDVDALAALFIPEVQVGRDRFGRDELKLDFARQLEPLGRTILHVTNQVIEVTDPDSATGTVGTRGELEVGDDWITQLIRYEDIYACIEGQWLFVRRKHRLWYGAPIGVNPLTLPPADWPKNAVGLGDL